MYQYAIFSYIIRCGINWSHIHRWVYVWILGINIIWSICYVPVFSKKHSIVNKKVWVAMITELHQVCVFIYWYMMHGTMKLKFNKHCVFEKHADPSGRSVKGVGLRPLACWDWGFETSLGQVCCNCCVLSDRRLCFGLITRPVEFYRV